MASIIALRPSVDGSLPQGASGPACIERSMFSSVDGLFKRAPRPAAPAAPVESARTRAADEVFGATAVATLTAGAVQTGQGSAINIVALPTRVLEGLATVWFSARRRMSEAEEA